MNRWCECLDWIRDCDLLSTLMKRLPDCEYIRNLLDQLTLMVVMVVTALLRLYEKPLLLKENVEWFRQQYREWLVQWWCLVNRLALFWNVNSSSSNCLWENVSKTVFHCHTIVIFSDSDCSSREIECVFIQNYCRDFVSYGRIKKILIDAYFHSEFISSEIHCNTSRKKFSWDN